MFDYVIMAMLVTKTMKIEIELCICNEIYINIFMFHLCVHCISVQSYIRIDLLSLNGHELLQSIMHYPDTINVHLLLHLAQMLRIGVQMDNVNKINNNLTNKEIGK
jgi:hypothetical protein